MCACGSSEKPENVGVYPELESLAAPLHIYPYEKKKEILFATYYVFTFWARRFRGPSMKKNRQRKYNKNLT